MKSLIVSLTLFALLITSHTFAQQKLWGLDATGVYSLNKDGSDFAYFCKTNETNYQLSSLIHSYGHLQALRFADFGDNHTDLIQISDDGDEYAVLHSFSYPSIPMGNLTANNDGYIYGFAADTLFRIRSDGSDFKKVRAIPYGDLTGGLVSRDGIIYGITNQNMMFGYDAASNHLFEMCYFNTFQYRSNLCIDPISGDFYGIGINNSDGHNVVFHIASGGSLSLEYIHDFSHVANIRNLTLGVTAYGYLVGVVQNGPSTTNDFFLIEPWGDNTYTVLANRNVETDKVIPDRHIIIHSNYFTNLDGNYVQGIFQNLASSNTGKSFALSGEYNYVFKIDQVLPDTTTLLAVNDANIGTESTGSLALNNHGELFGATQRNYSFAGGTIFKVNATGTHVLRLIEEGGKRIAADGVSVHGDYVFGNVSSGVGNIIRINQDGTDLRKIHQFNGSDGRNPYGKLISGNDGYLYGMTYSGGANTFGVIYRLKPDGTAFQKLYDFSNTSGKSPRGHLLDIGDDYIYGLTAVGGANNYGTIFKIKKDGTNFTKLLDFNGTNGKTPYGSLCLSSNGSLYGITSKGGSFNKGGIFKINPDGSGFNVISNFSTIAGAAGDLIEDSDGTLYGIASNAIFKINNNGSAFTVIAYCNFGNYPSLVLADASAMAPDIYVKLPVDSAVDVGLHPHLLLHNGKIGPSYTVQLSTVSDFSSVIATISSGSIDIEGPTLNYGTTYYARAKSDIYPVYGRVTSFTTTQPTERVWSSLAYGGAIYHVDTDGSNFTNYITIADQIPGFTDGPQSLTQLNDGSIVGTNYYGGAFRSGALFHITSNGFSVLHDWEEYDYGNFAQFTESDDGYIYGVGPTAVHNSRVFKMKTDGSDYHNNLFYKYGFEIAGGLTRANNGEIYGLSIGRGPGWIYKIKKDLSGVDQVFTFTSGPTGKKPNGEITIGPDGWLYMTLTQGGSHNKGTIFKISDDMLHYQKIHDFNGADGNTPIGEVKFDSHGKLFGVARYSTSGGGVLYSMDMSGNNFTVLHVFDTFAEGHLAISHDTAIIVAAGKALYSINTHGQNFHKLLDLPDYSLGKLILLNDTFDPPAIIPSARVATTADVMPSEQKPTQAASIFPNPSAGSFNVSVTVDEEQSYDLTVTDLRGSVVLQQNGTTSGSILFGNDLTQGTYLVKVSVGGQRVVSRVIKQ